MSARRLHVLFVAAAGPRIGFGHLVRCGVLAAGLRVRPRIALRATRAARRAARARGWLVSPPVPTVLRAMPLDLVIVDDPSARIVSRWIRAAKSAGIPIAAIRDVGAAGAGADLVIHGSLMADPASAQLAGPQYVVLDPVMAELRGQMLPRRTGTVVIALGGGSYVRRVGVEIAGRLRKAAPTVLVEVAPGFSSAPLPPLPAGCRWIDPHVARRAMATATVAVVAGGISMTEALALRTPAVAFALTPAQGVSIRDAATRGLVVNGGITAAAVAAAVGRTLRNPAHAGAMADAGARLVDGRGTSRVVEALRRLAEPHGVENRHAA